MLALCFYKAPWFVKLERGDTSLEMLGGSAACGVLVGLLTGGGVLNRHVGCVLIDVSATPSAGLKGKVAG
jgi:hypothetical protein